jgi:hypothetical protein
LDLLSLPSYPSLAHAGIEGEAAAVIPLRHLLAIIFVQQVTPLIGAQNAASHVPLDRLGVVRIQRWCLGEAHAVLRIELEYAVDDDYMEVDV